MLRELTIRDILLIEELDLDFHPGLNVLTGETGAGKSILLDCLGLVLGWRGRADIARQGASEGEVGAVFDLVPGHAAHAVLEEAGLPRDDQLILRRITSADGRKRGFVNDRRASGEVLRALSATLVELHGQQDDRGLLDPRGHRDLLDAFGGLEPLRDRVRSAWRALAAARKARIDAEETVARAARDADFLRHAVAELDAFAPEPGEDDRLDAHRRRMQMAGRIRDDVARAVDLMGGDGAEGRIAEAMRWLETVADRADGALDEPLAALGRALAELGEAQMATEGFLERLDVDPFELERTEERLFALRGLARKHDVLPDDLADLADDLRRKLAAIDGGAEQTARLRQEEAAAQAAHDAAAAALGAARREAAGRLDAAMAHELAPLKLERAVFRTDVSDAEPGPDGCDQVSFTVATNPGAPPGPLARIASGGELSRFLLALKVCLTGRSDGLTMIFDEIDRGVGGATADAVGRRLAQVAQASQVLVVTHSPQVAALGAHHFRVAKSVEAEVTRTRVAALDPEARVDEIARMLAGDVITDAARSAARALLAR
ncbi:DNA repair protein RecN [Halovulum dunhuangense]|uniref:DNA repair protein RecN n=1 Tax=Halovulum dunhuangense TaxID=1505036 RepID=A0A849L178_9RHOB|nr:DNA repair protein RecN [Halovulum dunhuangense]NNU80020.1 DNA repair protein RecN [Halovulum dunhuangense]